MAADIENVNIISKHFTAKCINNAQLQFLTKQCNLENTSFQYVFVKQHFNATFLISHVTHTDTISPLIYPTYHNKP